MLRTVYALSGDSITISHGNSTAEIDTVGAYVKNITLNGKDILKTSSDGVDTHGGMALLLPFANRVKDATYMWEGSRYDLPRNNEPHSIHGLTRDREWNVTHKGSDSVTLSFKLETSGYPVPLYLKVTYYVSRTSFTVTIDAENEGDTSTPFLAGMHPYFKFDDEWALKGKRYLMKLNYRDQYFPDGTFTVKKPDSIGSGSRESYDNAFIFDGSVNFMSGDRKLRISTQEMPFLVIYNGKYSEGVSVALEPMSGAPDAFNNGIGLISIPPGSAFHCNATFELLK